MNGQSVPDTSRTPTPARSVANPARVRVGARPDAAHPKATAAKPPAPDAPKP